MGLVGSALGCGLLGLFAGAAGAQCTGQTQYASPQGQWSELYEWREQLGAERCMRGTATPCTTGEESPAPTQEIAHAALIPKGPYAGCVLLWRQLQDVDPLTCRCSPSRSTYTWLFDPTSPATLILVGQQLNSSIFCAGHAWDPSGALIAAGGGEDPVVDVTCLFRPSLLGFPIFNLGSLDVLGGGVIPLQAKPPWLDLGAAGKLALPRYYATVITLPKTPVYGSGACPGAPSPIPGGSALALGGPPSVTSEGNEFWELLPSGGSAWLCPMLPQDPSGSDPNHPAEPSSPHFAAWPPRAYEEYLRPGAVAAERLLDSYPRAYVMSSGEVFVESDVDTSSAPQPNLPGSSWVIKPRYDGPGNWELHPGPFTNGLGAVDPSFDRYYGSSVLLHTAGGQDRLIAFGGSYDANYFAAVPPGSDPHWEVNDTAWELVPGANDPWIGAAWLPKTSDPRLQRVFANAVVLPTGEIFVVGGSSTDHKTHYLHETPEPVDEPVIYDPGAGASDAGTLYCMAPASPQPSEAGCSPRPTPRLHHAVATLLLDGRVLVAGGHFNAGCFPDSRYNGEVFSPPYLSEGWRPKIASAPSAAAIGGAAFAIEVERQALHAIDRVVLLRPGSVTHHWDSDQRYLELAHSLAGTTGGGPTLRDTLDVVPPTEMLCPPGYYVLYAVESDGADPPVRVPSVGVLLRFE